LTDGHEGVNTRETVAKNRWVFRGDNMEVFTVGQGGSEPQRGYGGKRNIRIRLRDGGNTAHDRE